MFHADRVAVSSAGGELEQIAAYAPVYTRSFTACHCVICLGSSSDMYAADICMLLLLPGAHVQSHPPVQGLVPYGDDD